MTTALLQYNSFSGEMNVIRQVCDRAGHTKRETKRVPIDVLRRIGDSDVDLLVDRALMFPGREHKITRGIRL